MMVPPASARTFSAVGYFPSYPRLHPSFRGTEPCPCIKLKNVAQTPKIREQLSLTTISNSGNHFARFHDSQSPDIPFESIDFLFRHRLTNHPMPQEPDATRSGNEAALTGMKTAVTGMKWSPRLFVVTPVVCGHPGCLRSNGYRGQWVQIEQLPIFTRKRLHEDGIADPKAATPESPQKRIRPDTRVAGRLERPACKINLQGKDTSQPNSSQEILPI